MTVDTFRDRVQQWIITARDPRWKRLYTEWAYQPMLEVMSYFRANGFRTYFVTGGGQDFVRAIAGVGVEKVGTNQLIFMRSVWQCEMFRSIA